jgi:hypothetical protein
MDGIEFERARSLRFVQIVFAVLALLSLFGALLVALRGDALGLPEHSVDSIAVAFLIVGIADTVLLYTWERIFKRAEF